MPSLAAAQSLQSHVSVRRMGSLRIWHLCAAIAAIAVLMSVDPRRLPLASKISLLVLGGTATAISYCARVPWLRAAVWVCAAYPILPPIAVVATWFAAWAHLGHVPRANFDDPGSLGTLVEICRSAAFLSLSITAAMSALCLCFVGLNVIVSLLRKNPYTRENMWMVLIPMLSWSALLLFFYRDPGGVVMWFFD